MCKLKYMGAVTKEDFVAMQKELIAKVCMLGVSVPIRTGPTFMGWDTGGVAVEGCYCSRCSDRRVASRLAAKAAGGKL